MSQRPKRKHAAMTAEVVPIPSSVAVAAAAVVAKASQSEESSQPEKKTKKEQPSTSKEDKRSSEEITKQLEDTFDIRRSFITIEMPGVPVILETYPTLFIGKHMLAEFQRISKIDIDHTIQEYCVKFAPGIVELAKHTSGSASILKQSDQAKQDKAALKQYWDMVTALCLIPLLLKENIVEMVREIGKDDEVDPRGKVVPILIARGSIFKSDKFFLVAEETVLQEFEEFTMAFATLFSSYWVFNMQYPRTLNNTYNFVQKAILHLRDETPIPPPCKQLVQKLQKWSKGVGKAKKIGSSCYQDDDLREVEGRLSHMSHLQKLREDIGMMDVTPVCEDVIGLTAPPVLQEVVDMNLDGRESDLRDVVVLNSNGVKSIVVSDHNRRIMKTVYMKNGRKCTSKLEVTSRSWALAIITQNKLALSFDSTKQILIVGVNPDLVLLSTITTSKAYYGLAVLDQSTLVAGSASPPSVDVLDMTGNVLRSFTTLTSIQKSFSSPYHLHVTNNGNILVSDWGLKSVICLTPTGEVVFDYSPTGNRVLKCPSGITSTTTGDIRLADVGAHKVIHLTQSGKFVKDILTSKDGLKNPIGVSSNGDKLYVATQYNGLHIFTFSQN